MEFNIVKIQIEIGENGGLMICEIYDHSGIWFSAIALETVVVGDRTFKAGEKIVSNLNQILQIYN